MARPRKIPTPRTGFAALLAGVAVLLVLAGGYLWFLGGTSPRPADTVGGPFRLTSSDGRTVTEQSFRGQYLLIYFGYSSCQDVCPTTLGAIAVALDTLGARGARIQPLFITVDPRRDTPAVLHSYVASFSPRLIGLTGTPAQLRDVQREYRVSSITHPGAPGSPASSIDHSSVLLLIAPDGTFLAPIPADEPAPEIAADIGRYLG